MTIKPNLEFKCESQLYLWNTNPQVRRVSGGDPLHEAHSCRWGKGWKGGGAAIQWDLPGCHRIMSIRLCLSHTVPGSASYGAGNKCFLIGSSAVSTTVRSSLLWACPRAVVVFKGSPVVCLSVHLSFHWMLLFCSLSVFGNCRPHSTQPSHLLREIISQILWPACLKLKLTICPVRS